MCLLTIVTGAARRYPIIILNNRDEMLSRSTTRLALYGTDAIPDYRANLLCAIDTSIPNGGTWMGVNAATGAFAAVTNSPQCASEVMHLPTVAPNRIKLSARSSSFDFMTYVTAVLSEASEGSRLHDVPRPHLVFAAERSRGFVVSDYLSKSSWGGDKVWREVIPSNIQRPEESTTAASPPATHDLFYDGYNLICGNLIDIATGVRNQFSKTEANDEVATHAAFLYTTNRQQPFPYHNRTSTGVDGDGRPIIDSAPAYSQTWASVAEKGFLPPLNSILLERQPALDLCEAGLTSAGEGDSVCIHTVSNTFLDNPLEPKSKHLTNSVRRTLGELFKNKEEPLPREGEGDVFVSSTLIPKMAECLSERPNYQLDFADPASPSRALLAVNHMGGLSDEEFKAAARRLVSDRALELAKAAIGSGSTSVPVITQMLAAKVGSDVEAAANYLSTIVAEDMLRHRKVMRAVLEEGEAEVHKHVYTHVDREALGLGTFKTRTQSVIVVEDLSIGSASQVPVDRFRLHFYMRDTLGPTQHEDWQVEVVDLPPKSSS